MSHSQNDLRSLKIQDRLNLSIALLSLILSAFVIVQDALKERKADSELQQKYTYDAHRLGQVAVVVYEYARTNANDPLRASELDSWRFEGEGYAGTFSVPTARFDAFCDSVINLAKNPVNVSDTFSSLNSTIEPFGGNQAVAAYDVSWRTAEARFAYITNPKLFSPQDAQTLANGLNPELGTIGISYRMSSNISDCNECLAELQDINHELDELKP